MLVGSAMAKIIGVRPNIAHLNELGFGKLVKVLGVSEIIFVTLLFIQRYSQIGLVLVTAYFAGAIAVEIPYHMAFAPAIPLFLIWLTSYVRDPLLISSLITKPE